jgi:tripartite-type tricarboxylate transporter receptor subunit TctC
MKHILAFLLLWAINIHAQPSKPITFVVTHSPGGTTDLLAREVIANLDIKWSQRIMVEFKTGAGGNLGAEKVVKSKPDGNTILVTGGSLFVSNPVLYEMNFEPLLDLEPIAIMAQVPLVLVVPASSDIYTIDDLLAYSKQFPKKVNHGSTGIGSTAHMASLLFAQHTGIMSTHIPYKGSEAVVDLISGNTQWMFATIPGVIQHINSKKLRAIAVTSKNRFAILPNVPTLQESKVNLVITTWFGLFAPIGTDPSYISEFNSVINDSVKKSTDKFLTLGATPVTMTSVDFKKYVKKEYDMWAPIIKKVKQE